jgi:hypothetical protein
MRAFALLLLLCPIGLYAQRGGGGAPGGPPPGPPKNLKILPADVNIQQVMGGIRTALGVQCNFCHGPAAAADGGGGGRGPAGPIDFASDENPKKLIARNMFRMVDDLNSGPLNGKMHVTCYTCHRGEATPKMEAPAPEGGGRGRGGRGAPPPPPQE